MTPDITDLAHERDGQGNLLPVEKTVPVRGEGETTVEVYPATSGQRNDWRRRLEVADDELSDELEAELLDEFAAYDPADFGAGDWSGVRPALVDALANAIFSELFDTGDDDFQEAVTDRMDEVTGNGQTSSTR